MGGESDKREEIERDWGGGREKWGFVYSACGLTTKTKKKLPFQVGSTFAVLRDRFEVSIVLRVLVWGIGASLTLSMVTRGSTGSSFPSPGACFREKTLGPHAEMDCVGGLV